MCLGKHPALKNYNSRDDFESSRRAIEKKFTINDNHPAELKCPYGDHLLKDAVLMPCCGHFVCCDECIREKI